MTCPTLDESQQICTDVGLTIASTARRAASTMAGEAPEIVQAVDAKLGGGYERKRTYAERLANLERNGQDYALFRNSIEAEIRTELRLSGLVLKTRVATDENTWSDKLSRYAPFAEIVVKTNPKNAKDPKAQMEAEGERVMKHIDARDYVVLMDERGKDITSEAMAKLLADAGDADALAEFCAARHAVATHRG